MVQARMRRAAAGTLVGAVLAATVWAGPAASADAAPTPQQAIDQGVQAASDDGVHQYVALIDRVTGQLVASRGGDTQVVSESVVKLFTVAYYLVKYNGDLPTDLADDLHEMIVHSNDHIESEYWTTAAVPAMAARYHLSHTENGAKTGPHDWGWEYITANDEASFLYQASQDPVVGPFLMTAMSEVAPVGADGFDQAFGFNSLSGDHGSKQGWTDLNTSAAINIHSVGWTPQYFGAILETSDSPQYNTMRTDSTATAQLIAALPTPSQRTASAMSDARRSVQTVAGQLTTVISRLLTPVGLT